MNSDSPMDASSTELPEDNATISTTSCELETSIAGAGLDGFSSTTAGFDRLRISFVFRFRGGLQTERPPLAPHVFAFPQSGTPPLPCSLSATFEAALFPVLIPVLQGSTESDPDNPTLLVEAGHTMLDEDDAEDPVLGTLEKNRCKLAPGDIATHRHQQKQPTEQG